MIQELDTVVLSRDIEEYRLKRGDLGAVLLCYESGAAFEVEFVTAEGETVAVLTLLAQDIRPIERQDMLHTRAFALAA
jgi:hypothetical protein